MSAQETFSCVDCGYPEDRHQKHFAPEERAKASESKGGYSTSLLGCSGYRRSNGQRRAERRAATHTSGYGEEEAPYKL